MVVLMGLVIVVMVVIVIVVVVVVAMIVVVRVVSVVVVPEDQHRHAVDDEPHDGDENRLVEGDRHRHDEPLHAFRSHQQREGGQQHGAREAAERVDLAGAETVRGIVRVPARVRVGVRVDAERDRVRRHVQTVGEQRHRAEHHARGDLDDHHRRRDRDHELRLALAGTALVLAERVIVAPARQSVFLHGDFRLRGSAHCSVSAPARSSL